MGIIGDIVDALRFKETVFYKETSELQDKYDALKKLNEEYPNSKNLLSEFYTVKQGLDGENKIAYQLKKSNIGMYVLRDVKVKHEDLKAQIDYVIITPVFIYYVECKNLNGNITVNEKGDFIREYTFNGKKVKKGMYSPLRQVEAQREVIRKIWDSTSSNMRKFLGSKAFDYYRRGLVLASNEETILKTDKAPSSIKYKILRADNLVRQIEYDLNHRSKDDYVDNKKDMETRAQAYMDIIDSDNVDWYEYYKEKYCIDDTEKRLLEFREERSKKMNIPAYYIFNDDELKQLIEVKPRTVDELKDLLPDIKIKNHGNEIIEVINKNSR